MMGMMWLVWVLVVILLVLLIIGVARWMSRSNASRSGGSIQESDERPPH